MVHLPLYEMLVNFLNHQVHILNNIFILYAQNSKAKLFKIFLSFNIVFSHCFQVMNCNVHLQDQIFGRAIEINYIISDTMLPPKFSPFNFASFEHLP